MSIVGILISKPMLQLMATPQDIVDKTIAKYLQAYELLTGKPLE